MTFYNKKEDVLDIQLTQHGKRSLADGTFRPHYYAFFDDEVLYDISYASETEHQGEIQDRILTHPRIKPPASAYGSETKISESDRGTRHRDRISWHRERSLLSPSDVDTELLLTDMLFDGSPIGQQFPGLEVALGGTSVFDNQVGATRTTGSYTSTSNINLKCKVFASYTETDGVFSAAQKPQLQIFLKQSECLSLSDEYEISLYEITAPSSHKYRSIESLYFDSDHEGHKLVQDLFDVHLDRWLPKDNPLATSFFEECENVGLNFTPPTEAPQDMMVRQVYQKMTIKNLPCEENTDE